MKEIIIVEDSTEDAEQAKGALSKAGLKNPVRVFQSGEEVLGYLASANPPAIILLDIKLPGISGFDVLDSLRKKPAFDMTLRVLFSDIDDIQTIKDVYAHGAHTFLTKPVQVEEVCDFVRNFRHWLETSNGMDSSSKSRV